jgi:hypothetical protein
MARKTAKDKLARSLTKLVWEARKSRRCHPEGSFDKSSRWYPSAREDCGGDGTNVRRPSASWPYSYMMRCRTRQHCQVLVTAALSGRDVPPDVADVVRNAPEPSAIDRLVDVL